MSASMVESILETMPQTEEHVAKAKKLYREALEAERTKGVDGNA